MKSPRIQNLHNLGAILLLVMLPFIGLSQERTESHSVPIGRLSAQGVPANGTFRVLVIYCKFSDDDFDLSPYSDGWPLSLNTLPEWARSGTVADTVRNYSFKSLSDYFSTMSGGKLNIIGDVYPDVVVPAHPSTYYYESNGSNLSCLSLEVLNTVDPKVDFARYDNNGDNIVEMILIIFRSLPGGAASVALMDSQWGPAQGMPSLTGTYMGFCDPNYYNIWRDNKSIRSYVYESGCWMHTIFNLDNMLEVAAHEMGHHMFGGVDYEGYGLMGRCGIMNSIERELLGWMQPITFRDTVGNISVDIPSLMNDRNAIKIVRPNETTYYLEGRYADHPYQTDWYYNYGLKMPGSGAIVLKGNHSWYNVLCANNLRMFAHRQEANDYFRPGYNEILSYYSRPSTSEKGNFGIKFSGIANGRMHANIYFDDILSIEPSKPYGLRLANTSGPVTLVWNRNLEPDMKEYNILRSVNSATFSIVGTVSHPDTVFIDSSFFLDSLNVSTAVYKIAAVDTQGLSSIGSDSVVAKGLAVSVQRSNTPSIPTGVGILNAYPNPFNPSTTIEFEISITSYTTLKLMNLLGQEVMTLYAGRAEQNNVYRINLDGRPLVSGVYVAWLQYEGKVVTTKLLLMK
jgi:M6 family metalloprotease-like protein